MESALAERHRLVSPDMAGHGRSDVPRADDAAWLADDLLAGLNVKRPVLVGWSFGSVVASAYADGGRPTRGIVLIGAGTRASWPPAGITLAQMRALIATAPAPTAVASPDALHPIAVDIFRRLLSPDPATEEDGIARMIDACRHVPLAVQARSIQIAEGRAIAPETRLLIATTVHDDAAFYARYDQPILQIHGAHDMLRLLALLHERAALLRFGETEIWLDSGHAPFDDEPDRFVRWLMAFCEETTS